MPDDTGTAEEQSADDLRSAIAAAADEVDKPDAPDVARETSTERPAAATGERARGPDGKFIAADEAAEAAPTPPAEGEKVEAAEQTPAAPAAPVAGEPPANWKPDAKEAFRTLPPEAQKILLTRHNEMEADYTRKTQGIAAFQKEYGPVHEMFTPHLEQMRANGFTPQSLIKAWSAVEQKLMTGRPEERLGVVKGIMDVYRIPVADLAQLFGHQIGAAPAANGHAPANGNGAAAPAVDPALSAALNPLLQEVQGLRQWRDQEISDRRTYAERAQHAELMRIDSEIEEFKGAKDDKGALLNPHYADVENTMAKLAKAYWADGQRPPALKELYDEAVWATPSTREKLLTARQQTEDARKSADARTKAAAAKKAGSSVTGGPSAGQTTRSSPDKSLREQLEEAAADAG